MMMQQNKKVLFYIDRICSRINTKDRHNDIRNEFLDYFECAVADIMEGGKDEKQAIKQATTTLGSPYKLGSLLNKRHYQQNTMWYYADSLVIFIPVLLQLIIWTLVHNLSTAFEGVLIVTVTMISIYHSINRYVGGYTVFLNIITMPLLIIIRSCYSFISANFENYGTTHFMDKRGLIMLWINNLWGHGGFVPKVALVCLLLGLVLWVTMYLLKYHQIIFSFHPLLSKAIRLVSIMVFIYFSFGLFSAIETSGRDYSRTLNNLKDIVAHTEFRYPVSTILDYPHLSDSHTSTLSSRLGGDMIKKIDGIDAFCQQYFSMDAELIKVRLALIAILEDPELSSQEKLEITVPYIEKMLDIIRGLSFYVPGYKGQLGVVKEVPFNYPDDMKESLKDKDIPFQFPFPSSIWRREHFLLANIEFEQLYTELQRDYKKGVK